MNPYPCQRRGHARDKGSLRVVLRCRISFRALPPWPGKKESFPVLVRPSYVLSGAAMRVCQDMDELERFLRTAAVVAPDFPVVPAGAKGRSSEGNSTSASRVPLLKSCKS